MRRKNMGRDRQTKRTEKEYKKLNKIYRLSQSGKLMLERIRKTKFKIGLVALAVFFVTFVIFFSLIFSESNVLNTKQVSDSNHPTNVTVTTTPTTQDTLLTTDKTQILEQDPTQTALDTEFSSSTKLELSNDSVTLIPLQLSTDATLLPKHENVQPATNNEATIKIDKSTPTNLSDERAESKKDNTKSFEQTKVLENELESAPETLVSTRKYHYVIAFNVSVFDTPESGKVVDTLKYATYVEKLDETTYNSVNFAKVRYNTPKGLAEGWIRSTFLSDSLKPITGEDYDELSFEPFKKIKARIENVRAIYLTRWSFNNVQKIQQWVNFAKSTNLNAFVVDVKDDDGFMLFETEAAAKFVPEANSRAFFKKDEMKQIVKELKDQGFYMIARIVCFKDPSYARAHKDRSIVYKDTGEPYMGIYKVPWASAYDRQLWEYNVKVAMEAAEVGFEEIQYDYVRFPELTKETQRRVNLRQVGNESFAEAIQKFLIYSKKKLEPYNIPLAADVFGLVSTAVDDVGIGQYWEAVSNVVDYICPMVYPSHYANGSFGLSVPDAYPYETVYNAIRDGLRRNLHIPTPARIRPWLQSFTATWVKGHIVYDEEAIRKQIKAVKDLGIKEYMLWNAANNYKKMWYE